MCYTLKMTHGKKIWHLNLSEVVYKKIRQLKLSNEVYRPSNEEMNRQKCHQHFTNEKFSYISMKEIFCILIQILSNCIPKSPIDNKSTIKL